MNDLTRNQVVATRDIVTELEARGVKLIGNGNERTAKCPFHEDGSPSFGVNVAKQVWKCHAGCGCGSVVDLIAMFEGKTPKEVFKDLAEDASGERWEAASASKPPARVRTADTGSKRASEAPSAKATISRVYQYRDSLGRDAYQVVRMEPKTFRQRHLKPDGSWAWSMDGVTRVLYRLPEIMAAQEVWVVEGEKDADTLVALGFEATCNVGGAGKWLDSYTDTLADKHVVICGDNDKPGQEHVAKVMESLAGKVATLRNAKLPASFKDASDYAAHFQTQLQAADALSGLKDAATPLKRGINLPLRTIAEMEASYIAFLKDTSEYKIDLGRWLPSLGASMRPLVPGDLVFILAATAVGKTAILQNIALAMTGVPTVMFELELSEEAMFERFVGTRGGFTGFQVEEAYRRGVTMGQTGLESLFADLLVCTESKMTVATMEDLCRKAELKLGRSPRLILVDYIQLMQGGAGSRYERFSDIAESLRRMAKALRAAVVVTSQVKRKDGDEVEVTLCDAKESGSIENSASVVLGAWREYGDDGQPDKMTVQILKQSRGSAGRKIECKWSPTLKIEQATT